MNENGNGSEPDTSDIPEITAEQFETGVRGKYANREHRVADDTRAYLDAAEARIRELQSVEELREKARGVILPRAQDIRNPTARTHGKFAPGAVNTVDPTTEALLAPLPTNDQRKLRRLKRRYEAATVETMHRHPDHATSVEAAHVVASSGMTELQAIIYACFVKHGEMNDEQLEALPEITRLNLGATTARKRRTDLYRLGKLEIVGTRKNTRGRKMNVYDIADRGSWLDERAPDT